MKPSKYNDLMLQLYPDYIAGYFAYNDNIVVFFNRVHALLMPEMEVLDFGAGRGKWATMLSPHKRRLVTLKGCCRKVVGADVDPAVQENPLLDEAVVVQPEVPLPFADAQFDMIVSYATFEHVQDAEFCARELCRVLKPGGWLCAWTPNKWGYVGIGARLIPNRFHRVLLRRVFRVMRRDDDIFPVAYRMNTQRDLRRLFPKPAFSHHSRIHTGPPSYHGNHAFLARFWIIYNALVPTPLRPSLHIFIRKSEMPDVLRSDCGIMEQGDRAENAQTVRSPVCRPAP